MIDYILGFLSCALLAGLIHHIEGGFPAKAAASPLQGLDLMATDLANQIISEIQAALANPPALASLQAELATAQSELAAEKQAHADDLAAIQATVVPPAA